MVTQQTFNPETLKTDFEKLKNKGIEGLQYMASIQDQCVTVLTKAMRDYEQLIRQNPSVPAVFKSTCICIQRDATNQMEENGKYNICVVSGNRKEIEDTFKIFIEENPELFSRILGELGYVKQ